MLNNKRGKLIFLIAALLTTQLARADVTCPSDVIRPFVGEWQGSALLIPVQGVQIQSRTRDTFAIVDCQTFKVTIRYLNPAGEIARTLNIQASADSTSKELMFTVNGTINEGSSVSDITGSFRHIENGTLLGAFSGAIGGKTAFLNELMNLNTLPTGEIQLTRTVQMFSERRGGPYIGTRIVCEGLL